MMSFILHTRLLTQADILIRTIRRTPILGCVGWALINVGLNVR